MDQEDFGVSTPGGYGEGKGCGGGDDWRGLRAPRTLEYDTTHVVNQKVKKADIVYSEDDFIAHIFKILAFPVGSLLSYNWRQEQLL